MENQNHGNRDRWEASLLAAAMAVLGGTFLFDKLGSLVRTSILSFQVAFHSSPVLLVVVGTCLLLVLYRVATAEPAHKRSKGAQHEL
jgi:hypothetical protein